MFTSKKQFIYPVKELAKAIEWYSDILSASPIMDSPNTAVFAIDEGRLRLEGPSKDISPREDVSEQAANPSILYSDIYWEVENVDVMLNRLISKGAILHTPIFTSHRMRTAKAVDPFGNVIGLFEKCQSFGHIPTHTSLSAFARALAVRDHRQILRGPDHFAYIFLDIESRELLESKDKRRWAIENLVTSPVYGYFLSRTNWFDYEFKEACRRNMSQIVMLGAGYDTRAIRFRDHLKTTKVFEVDIASLLNHKAERLAAASVSSISNLCYVSIDLETDSLLEKLQTAGFDTNQKTLFFWEGGSYYQSKDCIRSLLSFFKDYAAPGSSVVFDALKEELPPAFPEEPYRFSLSPEDAPSFFDQYDMKIKNLILGDEMVSKYLTDRNGKVMEKCLSSFYFVHADKEITKINQ